MPDRLVVANTSPLYYLHQVGHLGILRVLYGRIVVPPAVEEEIGAGSEAGLSVPELPRTEWIEVKPIRSRELIPVVVDLGPGEAEVLALGMEWPGSLLILDDQHARRVARLNSLTFTGTLGVLVKAKHAGHLKSIRTIVEDLRGAGLWLTDDLVAMTLQQANE
jgi:predicted nucleic acid-binding protein